MYIHFMQQGKEVIALDADDHLVRPISIRVDYSDLRLSRVLVDRLPTRNLLCLCAA